MHTFTKLAGAIASTAAAAILVAGPAAADADTINERIYIDVLDDEGIYYSSEDAALNYGYVVCKALDNGATFPMIVRSGVQQGVYSAYQVGYITGAAIGAFCPEHADAITGRALRTHA